MLGPVTREAARRFGDRAAFVDSGGRALTYRELDRRSEAVGAALGERGVGRGEVVGLSLGSGLAHVVAQVGVAKAGAVRAPINPRLDDDTRARCLAVVDPAVEVADDAAVAGLASEGAGSSAPSPPPDPDRRAAVVFTSGTSGRPRAAWFRDREIAAVTAADVGDRWGDPREPATPMLAATEMAHVGFSTKLAWYLRLGTTTHLLARWRAGDVLALIERERLATLGGVASQLALLLRHPDLDRTDTSSLRAVIMGGAPSPPALVTEARERLGVAYSIRYSSTESGGVGTATAFDADDAEALYTVGRPRHGVEVDVRDGKVWLRSPTQMAGYWGDPEATAATLVDGWLRTGDTGHLDERGCLVITGRADDVYIRGGYNVAPAAVEATLADHPAVGAVAIAPRPDPVMGEIGVAVVVPQPGHDAPSVDELRRHAATRLAHHELPEAAVVVDALPHTAMDKLDRRALRALVAE